MVVHPAQWRDFFYPLSTGMLFFFLKFFRFMFSFTFAFPKMGGALVCTFLLLFEVTKKAFLPE